jgi:hypothetical protein
MPCSLRIGLWPEQSDQLVAAETGVSSDREEREQRESAALSSGPRHLLSGVVPDVHATKRMQARHL